MSAFHLSPSETALLRAMAADDMHQPEAIGLLTARSLCAIGLVGFISGFGFYVTSDGYRMVGHLAALASRVRVAS